MNRMKLSRTLVLALAGVCAASAPAAAQYYDDDNGPDDGAYYDNNADRNDQYSDDNRGGYDDTYSRASQSYWDTDNASYDDPDVSFFHDELSNDGRWVTHAEYGNVWSPSNVGDDWRPYSRGHWVNTDEHGWYWVSDEPFGWATYHYGRWFLDDRRGWLWVPGTTWGPAWVAWRSSDSFIGWAPLPPEASWDRSSGLRYDATFYESSRFSPYWSFVEPRYISTPSVYRYCAPRHRARTIIYNTRPVTRYDYRGDRVMNVGISVSFFDRYLGSRLSSVRVFATDSRIARGHDRRAGDTIRVWRPDFKRQYQHASRPHTARPAGAGFWRNVDRYAGRTAPPAPKWEPTLMGRKIEYTAPPAARQPATRSYDYSRQPAPPVDTRRFGAPTRTPSAAPPAREARPEWRGPDRRNWENRSGNQPRFQRDPAPPLLQRPIAAPPARTLTPAAPPAQRPALARPALPRPAVSAPQPPAGVMPPPPREASDPNAPRPPPRAATPRPPRVDPAEMYRRAMGDSQPDRPVTGFGR